VRFVRLIPGLSLLILTWIVSVYHLSVFPAPQIDTAAVRATGSEDRFIPRTADGLNHIILSGHPYKRGLSVGRFTKDLLDQEEDYLVAEMERFFPAAWLRHSLLFAVRRFYWGIERWFPDWAVAEMAGVATYSTDKYNYYADPLTRQIAYHGVHELGQMFVDFDKGDYGCTLMAVPVSRAAAGAGWVIGRNFDFEAVRILDTEKLIKWVYPDDGYAYVAVTWAGMVGAVTGVNEHGVYISINAAGSSDFRRYGTPSTLVLVDALQRASTAAEARDVIEAAEVFITDLYVVADAGGTMFRIEKTPERVRSVALSEPAAVANHLMHPDFADDGVNRFRYEQQTTRFRWHRAQDLATAAGLDPALTSDADYEDRMLAMLRDRSDAGGRPAHLGNRRSLDALIATHSVIFNTRTRTLFVSRGPALSGAYNGYDLTRSFGERRPVPVRTLPADPEISEDFFFSFKAGLAKLTYGKEFVRRGDCATAAPLLEPLESLLGSHAEYLQAMGDLYQCRGQDDLARRYWQRALTAGPSYAKHEQYLRGRLQ
jgi:hypothetical protein